MCNFVVGHVYCMYKENLQVKTAIRFILSVDQLVTTLLSCILFLMLYFSVNCIWAIQYVK